MTIETRMSYPEGGSECPPEESPVPGSPSSMATSSEARLGHTCPASTCEEALSSSSASSSNQSNKVKVIPSPSQSKSTRKLRNVKNLPILQGKPNDQSYDEITNVNNNSTDKDDQCTNCTMSLAGNVKVEDLRKPLSKAKPSPSEVGEGSNKEEAASRKSMRLRLKRRNPADGPIGSKKLPRYVEDLAEIDFTDDKQKIQFMHVLGMSFTPRIVEMESQLSPESVVSVGPEKASEEKVPGISISPVLVKCDKGVETEPKIIKTEFNKSDRVGAPDLTLLPLKLNKRQKSKVSDENSGWENWVKQLLDRGKAKPEPISPTIQEINESLARLHALGTTVKIVK